MDEPKTRVDRFNAWIKNNPVMEEVHRYEGKVLRDEITFIMQTQGSEAHIPIEFTARRVLNTSPSSTR